jgi:hypothetical protein
MLKKLIKKIVAWFKNLVTKSRRTVKHKYYKVRAKTTKNWYKKAKLSLKALSSKYLG